MAVKQRSWRGSNRALFLFSLLLVPTYLFSGNPGSSGGAAGAGADFSFNLAEVVAARARQEKAIAAAQAAAARAESHGSGKDEDPSYGGDASAAAAATGAQEDVWPGKEEGFARPLSDAEKATYVSHGRTYEQMMEAFEEAPVDARMLVDHLKKPLDPEWRTAIFKGPPGTLKTTTALAIPHLANWHLAFVPAARLLGSYRNQAKEGLQQELQSAIGNEEDTNEDKKEVGPRPRKKTVLMVDELHKLLEHHGSERHDSGATGSYLWTFLDEQARNEDFFFIGTLNSEDDIEDPLKHRLHGTTIEFPLTEDPPTLIRMFKNQISRNPDLVLDAECTDAFFNTCIDLLLSEAPALSPRDFQNVRLKLVRETHVLGSEERKRIVKPEHLLAATKHILARHAEAKIGAKKLTDAEWRDFNYVQSRILDIKMQSKGRWQFSGNAGAGAQGPHAGGNVGFAPGIDLDHAIAALEDSLTPEQIALYKQVESGN